MPDIENVFLAEGDMICLEGNKPLLLNDSEHVWIVQDGRLDIFSVPMCNGEPSGRLQHFYRVEAGMVLFGLNLYKKEGMGLLAYGASGTHLLKVSKSKLFSLANDVQYQEHVVLLLQRWVHELSMAVNQDIPPREFIQVYPDETLNVGENSFIRPEKEMVWVQPLSGKLSFIGAEWPCIKNAGFYPLNKKIWLYSHKDSELQIIKTEDFIKQDIAGESLDLFHDLVLQYIGRHRKEQEAKEKSRFRKKVVKEKKFVEDALSELATVVVDEKEETLAFKEGEFDPMFMVCRLVGEAMEIEIVKHQLGENDSQHSASLEDIVRASHIRMRQVILKGEWWCKDNGPLVGYMEEYGRPVALLPVDSRSYELVDPQEQTRTKISAKNVQSLKLFAYSFYRPFSAHSINWVDLLRFELKDITRKDMLTVMLMGILGGLLSIIIPVATGVLFDRIIPGSERGQLVWMTVLLMSGALAAFMFQITRAVTLVRIEGKMNASLQAAVWDRLLRLPTTFFRRFTAGDLATRALGIDAIHQVLSGAVISTLFTSVISLFNLVVLFFYDMTLAWIAVALGGVFIGVMVLLSVGQIRYHRLYADIEGKISGLVLQIINGIAKFRVAGAENRAFYLWAKQFGIQRKIAFKLRMIFNYLSVFNGIYPIITTMIIFAMYVSLQNIYLSTGNFLAFNAAFTSFLMAMVALSSIGMMLLNIIPLYERGKVILQELPEVDEAKMEVGELAGEIEVNHACFRYKTDGRFILDDVSVHIKPGEFVAFVGPSGSGKSTLFRLLLGFEKPESGAIYYDGQDLVGLDVQSVRRQIGVVLQNDKLLSGDIFTNIIGTANLTLDDAWEAARMAGLDEDIRQMPMEMHTFLTEGAGTLSGGQRQRLLIARAIVRRPHMLFFDEATSALDNRTQAIVSESLDNLQATRIVVAHRLSTIVNADRIYVLHNGRIVQNGTYEELINQEGLFAKLAKRQLA